MYRNQDNSAPVVVSAPDPSTRGHTQRLDQLALAVGRAANVASVGENKPQRLGRRKLVLGAVVAIGVGAAGWFGYDYLTVGRFMVSTDDAYVQAYNTTLAAKVAGYVAGVPVTDNTYVRNGDVIATIDDGDYRLAVELGAREGRDPGSDRRADGSSDRRAGSCRRAG